MFTLRFTILFATLILAAARPAVSQNSKPAADAPAGKPSQTAPTQAAPTGGVRVFVDPATGKIIEPSDAQIRALSAAESATPKPRAEVTQIIGPNGAIGLVLTPDFASYAVATRTPDGQITLDCVTGEANAQRIVIGGPQANSKVAPASKAPSDEKK